MARSVTWTELAWQDLERIAHTIAQDSPTYAASFARRVWKRAQSLDELPYRGRGVGVDLVKDLEVVASGGE